MSDVIQATYVNARGNQIAWGADGAHILTSIDGLGGLDAIVSTNLAPGQDGETWLGSRLPVRTITLTGAVIGRSAALGERRRELMRACNARGGMGTLTITAYGRVKCIPAIVLSGPVIIESSDLGWQTYTLSFECPMPYFLDASDTILDMQTRVGGLKFLLGLPTQFSRIKRAYRYLARNEGDGECPLTFEFAGGAVAPTLTNLTTGEYIKVNHTVPDNKTLIISTELGKKRAYLRDNATGAEESAMRYLDLKSVFFGLEPGDNYLSYGADDDAAAAMVRVRWRTRYAGF